MDWNLPPWTTQRDLDFRDEELEEDTDTWLLDDDSDDIPCYDDKWWEEARLEPLLDNLQ